MREGGGQVGGGQLGGEGPSTGADRREVGASFAKGPLEEGSPHSEEGGLGTELKLFGSKEGGG